MRSEITRRQFSDNCQSWFSYHYACWANNHRGWQKMKKINRRKFKRKYKQEMNKEVQQYLK